MLEEALAEEALEGAAGALDDGLAVVETTTVEATVVGLAEETEALDATLEAEDLMEEATLDATLEAEGLTEEGAGAGATGAVVGTGQAGHEGMTVTVTVEAGSVTVTGTQLLTETTGVGATGVVALEELLETTGAGAEVEGLAVVVTTTGTVLVVTAELDLAELEEAAADEELATTELEEAAADEELALTELEEAAADEELATTELEEAAADEELALTELLDAAAEEEEEAAAEVQLLLTVVKVMAWQSVAALPGLVV